MSLTNSQYNAILRSYEEKQRRTRIELEERTQQVYQTIPEYEYWERQVSTVSIEQGKKLLNGDESALEDLKDKIKVISEKKALLLKQYGFAADYLSPRYECPICKDTGYVDNRKCNCFKRAEIELIYEQSNIKNLLKTDNFSSLSYDYYDGDDLKRFTIAVKECQNFVKTFNSDYHNLFFYGTVGTGKSFLSGCVAKALMDQGHSVIYFSATGLFEKLSQVSFDYAAKDELADLYEDLYSCDLLIIDDLGTELTNNFSSSQFFSCLNERILRKKSIIISTNLSLQELRDRYSDRIFSRITSNFKLCKITGPDIRMYKKRLSTRK